MKTVKLTNTKRNDLLSIRVRTKLKTTPQIYESIRTKV